MDEEDSRSGGKQNGTSHKKSSRYTRAPKKNEDLIYDEIEIPNELDIRCDTPKGVDNPTYEEIKPGKWEEAGCQEPNQWETGYQGPSKAEEAGYQGPS